MILSMRFSSCTLSNKTQQVGQYHGQQGKQQTAYAYTRYTARRTGNRRLLCLNAMKYSGSAVTAIKVMSRGMNKRMQQI